MKKRLCWVLALPLAASFGARPASAQVYSAPYAYTGFMYGGAYTWGGGVPVMLTGIVPTPAQVLGIGPALAAGLLDYPPSAFPIPPLALGAGRMDAAKQRRQDAAMKQKLQEYLKSQEERLKPAPSR